jgi:hypothetical protein
MGSDANLPLTEQAAPTRTLFNHGPEESKLFQLPSGVTSHPQYTSCALPFAYQEFGVRAIANSARTFSCKTSPEPRMSMVNESTLPFLSWISLSGNRNIRCRGSHVPRIPEPQTPMPPVLHSCLGSHTATSSSGLRGSRIHDTSFFVVKNPEMPNAETLKSDFSGSRDPCPYPGQRFPLNREIAGRDFDAHATLASPNAEARYADTRRLLVPPAPPV